MSKFLKRGDGENGFVHFLGGFVQFLVGYGHFSLAFVHFSWSFVHFSMCFVHLDNFSQIQIPFFITKNPSSNREGVVK